MLLLLSEIFKSIIFIHFSLRIWVPPLSFPSASILLLILLKKLSNSNTFAICRKHHKLGFHKKPVQLNKESYTTIPWDLLKPFVSPVGFLLRIPHKWFRLKVCCSTSTLVSYERLHVSQYLQQIDFYNQKYLMEGWLIWIIYQLKSFFILKGKLSIYAYFLTFFKCDFYG